MGSGKKSGISDGADNDDFGISVSMSGNNVIVGAHLRMRKVKNAGAAYILNKDQGGEQ